MTDRKQYVAVDEATAPTLTISWGVPQGLVLGPILFLLYINDLHNSCDLLPIIFADDTNVFLFWKSNASCGGHVNSQFVRLVHWIRANNYGIRQNAESHNADTTELCYIF